LLAEIIKLEKADFNTCLCLTLYVEFSAWVIVIPLSRIAKRWLTSFNRFRQACRIILLRINFVLEKKPRCCQLLLLNCGLLGPGWLACLIVFKNTIVRLFVVAFNLPVLFTQTKIHRWIKTVLFCEFNIVVWSCRPDRFYQRIFWSIITLNVLISISNF